MSLVRLSLHGPASVRVEAGAFPSEQIQLFRRAVEGSSYDRGAQARVMTLERVPALLSRLREARIDVETTPEVDASLEQHRKEYWLDVRGAEDRIAALDVEIRRTTGGVGLRPYQFPGARWLSQRTGALLADQPRMGKTLISIVSLPPRAPVVVVAPAGVKTTWASEFKKWRPSIRVRVLAGRDSFRWPEPGEVLVTNYDILPDVHDRRICDGMLPARPCPGCRDVFVTDRRTGRKKTSHTGHTRQCEKRGRELPRELCPGCHPMLERCPPGTVVVGDEIHRAKAKKSGRAVKMRALMAAARRRAGRSWGLSGTPMENGPEDLWFVFMALGIAEEAFGSRANFVRLFKGRSLDHGQFVWGIPDGEAAACIEKVALRRTRREYHKELPEKTYQDVVVDVDRATLAACDEVLDEVGGADALAELIEQGIKKDGDGKVDIGSMSRVRTALAAAKIPALLELVEVFEDDEEERLLIFAEHRAPIDAMEKMPGWAAIHGGVRLPDRDRIIADFQAGRLKGIACMIQSAGEGLKLSRATREIFVDQAWKPSANEQAEDRPIDVDENKALVVMIMKARHPLDERITEVLMRKRRIIAASVEAASVRAGDRALPGFEGELQRLRAAAPSERTRDDELSGRLHEARFEGDASRERVAVELAEESAHLGLTADGWELARRVLLPGAPDRPIDEEKADRQAGGVKRVSGRSSRRSSKPIDGPRVSSYEDQAAEADESAPICSISRLSAASVSIDLVCASRAALRSWSCCLRASSFSALPFCAICVGRSCASTAVSVTGNPSASAAISAERGSNPPRQIISATLRPRIGTARRLFNPSYCRRIKTNLRPLRGRPMVSDGGRVQAR